MEPANQIILSICRMVKMAPSLPTHGPHLSWGTPGNRAHLPKRPVWSAASAGSPLRAAWRWRQLLITEDLKIPMPLTAPPCGVQRQVVFYAFFACVFFSLWDLLSLFPPSSSSSSPHHFYAPLPLHPLLQPARKTFSKKEALPWKNKDLKSL
uniref:Uncharacterized protein n=1 Tax=Sus scrofa TaxID=9823 RepID=A0A8D1LGA1_PIG